MWLHHLLIGIAPPSPLLYSTMRLGCSPTLLRSLWSLLSLKHGEINTHRACRMHGGGGVGVLSLTRIWFSPTSPHLLCLCLFDSQILPCTSPLFLRFGFALLSFHLFDWYLCLSREACLCLLLVQGPLQEKKNCVTNYLLELFDGDGEISCQLSALVKP